MRIALVTTVLVLTLAAAVGLLRTNDSPIEPALAAVGVQLLPLSGNATPLPNELGLAEPVAGFLDRITKKNFGIYITPDTSPVENDKFTGYHTGVDAEFTDTVIDIPVYAIADGTIVLAKWVNGYGGLIVIRHTINGAPIYALYGHLDEASFPAAGTTLVTRGDQIAVLGDDHSQETDGVRKHIHFAIYTGEKVDYRGYVPNQEDLANWMDPLDLYR
jgi:murein DD-endopeptidase MepM/ murein hydrolase activator NlpD